MAAKLPHGLIQPPDRRLEDMRPGETSYVAWMDLEVGESGELYLRPKATLTRRYSRTVQVERRVDGFHVVLIAKGIRWQITTFIKEDAIPVASVRERYDPELDQEALDADLNAMLDKVRKLNKELDQDSNNQGSV
jgi:hypothetical protein